MVLTWKPEEKRLWNLRVYGYAGMEIVMIDTVTFNPSLDYLVTMKEFRPGQVNRSDDERICPGGKGINVSQVLRNLGCDSTALGFIAGFTGDEILRMLTEKGVKTDFIRLEQGMSRINIKIQAGPESEINAGGPEIGPQAVEELFRKLLLLKEGDTLVLAGSIPPTLPGTMYQDICAMLAGRKIRIVVDATRQLLSNVLKFRPFLIKPNHHELGELFGVELRTREEVIPYARRLREEGAENVLVSMAGEGAVLAAADGAWYEAPAPSGKVRNSVGAGDSMVAGFLAGYEKSKNYREAFLMGLYTGSATAFSDGLAELSDVERLRESEEAVT